MREERNERRGKMEEKKRKRKKRGLGRTEKDYEEVLG